MSYSEEAITGFLNEFHGCGKGLKLILSSCPVGGVTKAVGYVFDFDQQITQDVIMSKAELLAMCVARSLEVEGYTVDGSEEEPKKRTVLRKL